MQVFHFTVSTETISPLKALENFKKYWFTMAIILPVPKRYE
jgi:hypothetical protein